MLVVLLLVVIGVQACIINMLIKLIKQERAVKKAERKQSRSFIKALIRAYSQQSLNTEDYKNAYNECYAEYKRLFKSNKQLRKELENLKSMYSKLEDAHGQMCANLTEIIYEGRLIKSKYGNQVFTYDFNHLTKAEVIELFGNPYKAI